jgi:hypothetical protein
MEAQRIGTLPNWDCALLGRVMDEDRKAAKLAKGTRGSRVKGARVPSGPTLADQHLAETEIEAIRRELEPDAKNVVRDVIEIGRHLTEAKERAGHGNWLPWLKREFPAWSERSAQRFLETYEVFKSANLADLGSIDVSGLYLVAAESTPEAARAEVLDRAANGEALTHDRQAAHERRPTRDGARDDLPGAGKGRQGKQERHQRKWFTG